MIVTKLRLNHTLLFVLITAFLTMQWSAAHIHLAEHHDHDGSHHQHSFEAHAHQLAGHHTDTIDLSHQASNFTFVEIDYKFNTVKGSHQKKPSAAAIILDLQWLIFYQLIRIELPEILNTKLSFFYRSAVNVRAPPRLSYVFIYLINTITLGRYRSS